MAVNAASSLFPFIRTVRSSSHRSASPPGWIKNQKLTRDTCAWWIWKHTVLCQQVVLWAHESAIPKQWWSNLNLLQQVLESCKREWISGGKYIEMHVQKAFSCRISLQRRQWCSSGMCLLGEICHTTYPILFHPASLAYWVSSGLSKF